MAELTTTPVFGVSTLASIAGGAEVAAYDALNRHALILGPNGVVILDAATGAILGGIPKTDVQVPGGGAPLALGSGNSVAVRGDLIAIAFDGPAAGSNGAVAFFQLSTDGTAATWLRTVTSPTPATFAVPDQLIFTPDGSKLLVAIEGEPTSDYRTDPLGGVGVIDVATGDLRIAGFEGFDKAALLAAGVRLNGPAFVGGVLTQGAASVAADLEPEYITVARDGLTAWVTLQEANAIATVSLVGTPTVIAIQGLGLKDFAGGPQLDVSDQDGPGGTIGAQLGNWPVQALYMPDAITSFEIGGRTFLVTANEGDYRGYGAFNDEIRVGDPTYVLDPTVFPDAATLKLPAQLGRLSVSRTDGDLDGDGDYDAIITGGARSFTIWSVGDGGAITRTYDSGDIIERTLQTQFPSLFDDTRSDNKGPEPESVALARIGGELFALVGVERTVNSSAVLAFRITDGDTVEYAGTITGAGDLGPEVIVAVPEGLGAIGIGGVQLIVPSEVSGTVRSVALENPMSETFTLQILHASDFEGQGIQTGRAQNFAAIVDVLEDEYENSLTLSSGDNFIPGPVTAAGTDPSVRDEIASFYEQLLGLPANSLSGIRGGTTPFNAADIAVLNAIGVRASVLGNHDFDLGPSALASAFDTTALLPLAPTPATLANITNIGALFPYISANLNFSAETTLSGLFTSELRDAASYGTTAAELSSDAAIRAEVASRELAPWTTFTEGGETIGFLGLTTQILASISTLGNVTVADPFGDGGVDNTDELAAILQPLIDQMTALGIDKIILATHLQQIANERSLATKLSGVDIILGGGSSTLFADATDTIEAGDTVGGDYPEFYTGADGETVLLVNNEEYYRYVGRLVVTFDDEGHIIEDSIDPDVSGVYVTTDAGVDAVAGNGDGVLDADEQAMVFADGTRGGEVKQISDAIQAVINVKDGNVVGFTDVFLEGRRNFVRSEETNLGDLSADANLAVAKSYDLTAVISLKNGGGIRAEIGTLSEDATPVPLPPQANPDAGKPEGGISQLDIENSLRFNNALSLATLTAQGIKNLLENAVRAVATGATPGAFPQISGLKFSFDPTRAALDRVLDVAVVDQQGAVIAVIAENGTVVGDPTAAFRIATLGFLLPDNAADNDGGDSIIVKGASVSDNGAGNVFGTLAVFTDFAALDRVDLSQVVAIPDFETVGREQSAFADYLASLYGTPDVAFGGAETPRSGDERTQNLTQRAEDVIGGGAVVGAGLDDLVVGTAAGNTIDADAGNDSVYGVDGDDRLLGKLGDDSLNGGTGDDVLRGGSGDDTLVGAAGDDRLSGGPGADVLVGGTGADRFVINNQGGTDTVLDFTAGEDRLLLSDAGFTDFAGVQAAMTENVLGVTITIDGDSFVLLGGVTMAALSASDFVF